MVELKTKEGELTAADLTSGDLKPITGTLKEREMKGESVQNRTDLRLLRD
jgi:hypothetical protein